MKEEVAHEIELNFYYIHYHDAEKFIEFAKNEKSKLKSLYVRHAILSVVFASEALINRTLNDFYTPKECDNLIEKLSIPEKWCIVSLVCVPNKSSETFVKSEEPFQSFAELIRIRNWLVHPKANEFINATTDSNSTITILETGKEVLWIETLKGKVWPQTKIPFNPFELTRKWDRFIFIEARVTYGQIR